MRKQSCQPCSGHSTRRGAGGVVARRAAEIGGGTVLLGVLAAMLFSVPESWTALDHFETPRRLLWSVVACAVLASAAFRRGARQPSLHAAGGAWVAALVLWMLLRAALRASPAAEFEVLVTWLLPPLLFLAGRTLSDRACRGVATAFVAAGAAQMAVMALQRFGLDPLYPETTARIDYPPGRMLGSIGYQNQAVDAVAVGVAAFVWLRPRWRWVGVGLLAGTATLAAHRSGLAGALLGALALTAVTRRRGDATRSGFDRGALTLAAAGVLALAMVVPEMRQRIAATIRQGRELPAIRTRATMAAVAIELWREHPLIGAGPGEFALQYGPRLGKRLPIEKTHRDLQGVVMAREAHNDGLQLGAEFGWIGVALAGAAAAGLVRGVKRLPVEGPTALPSAAFLAAYFAVACATSFAWQYAVAGPAAALWLGALTRAAGEGGRHPAARWGCVAGAGLALAAAAFFGRSLAVDRSVLAIRVGSRPPEPWGGFGRQRVELGGLLATQGRWEDARRCLESARTVRWDVALLNNLGHVLAKRGDWEGALAAYREWTASGLDHGRALANEAVALERLGRFGEAGTALLRKHRLWPTDSSSEDVRRTVTLLLRGARTDEAEHLLTQFEARCAARDPQAWTAEWENLAGAVARRRGNASEALRRFRRALERSPGLESASRNLIETEPVAPP